ncbi:MAG: thermonuclease family protein, partial [Halioglobus sp.]
MYLIKRSGRARKTIYLTQLSVVLSLALLLVTHAGRADPLPEDFKGWVITVLSGDRIRVLDAGNRIEVIRLQSIAAPHLDQPYGEESRKSLSELLSGKEISVKVLKRDGTEQVLARVLVEPGGCLDCKHTVDVALEQVKQGMAWWTVKFAKKQSKSERADYESADTAARNAKLGLWADPEPVPP